MQVVPGTILGDFTFDGKVYGVMRGGAPQRNIGDIVIVRFDGFRAVPVNAVIYEEKTGWFSRKDVNGDGRLDARDGGEIIKGRDGKPVPGRLDNRYMILQPDGTIFLCDATPAQWGTLWRPSRDADGTPVYRMEGRTPLPRPAGGFISPYDGKPDKSGIFTWAQLDPRGGYAANMLLFNSPDGTGLLNNAGTDVVGFDAQGRVRWFHLLDRDKGLEGLAAAGPLLLTGVATTNEIIVMDRDGLGVGSFSPPERAHYAGYFLDHPPAVTTFRGPDGRNYALIADNFNGRHHWYRLEGADRIKPATMPATLTTGTASALAAEPAPPPYTASRPSQPVVRVPRLARPLMIDGNLAKWREAGVKPQIVVTPESSGGSIDGPLDCSAVVRLAYEGNDLYAQFLIFDDVVSFHQDLVSHYLQDGVELCINGFLTGLKFDATKLADLGPVVYRNRYGTSANLLLPESHVPRSIRVLDDARDVPERDLVEVVYGVDLSRSRVIAIEFKLPIDAVTYKGSPKELKEVTPWGPGRDFWFGMLINDNDVPGTNVQNFLLWPPTYNNFASKEEGARAILE
jgi:hypothetical protein